MPNVSIVVGAEVGQPADVLPPLAHLREKHGTPKLDAAAASSPRARRARPNP